MLTDDGPLVNIGVRCPLSVKERLQHAAMQEQRTPSNLAGLLIAWALDQLPRAGNVLNLKNCTLQRAGTGIDRNDSDPAGTIVDLLSGNKEATAQDERRSGISRASGDRHSKRPRRAANS